MQILVFVFGIILFIGLVLVHEWGHFIVARRNGVDAEEFGLGFPPRILGRKLKSGLLLSVNVLPLGGFVKLKGEHDDDKRKGSFGVASLVAKAKILLAGVTMNLLVGLIMLTILAWIGMPKLITKDNALINEDQFTVASDTKVSNHQVLAHQIISGSPAAKIGLNGTDQIIDFTAAGQNYPIHDLQDLVATTKKLAGQTVMLTYRHKGQVKSAKVTLLSEKVVAASKNTKNPQGYLGVADPTDVQIQRSTWSAPVVAVGLTVQIFKLTFIGLGHALSGLGSAIAGLVTNNHAARENGQTQASNQVGGPVAIGYALWNSGSLGFNFMLFLIALISLTLALMNVLPIPALDGGRLFLILVSHGVFKRPLSRLAEERLVGTSFVLLMALIVLITIVDVKRFF